MNILIVFETQNGTTQYVAEVMEKQLQDAGHKVNLHSIRSKGMKPDLTGVDVVLYGAPTYDDGLLEQTMRNYISQDNPDLSQKKVAVFGLGNKFYPQFCYSAKFLAEWVEKNHGVLMVENLMLDAFPDNLEPVHSWVEQILQKLV